MTSINLYWVRIRNEYEFLTSFIFDMNKSTQLVSRETAVLFLSSSGIRRANLKWTRHRVNSGNRGARGHKGSDWNLLSCKRGKGFKMSSINTKIAAQTAGCQTSQTKSYGEPTSQSAVVAKIAALQLAGTLAKIRFKKILIIIGIGAYLEDKFSQFILTLLPRGF